MPAPLRPLVALIVRHTAERGRGVFAEAPIADGTLIEECPVIVLPAGEVEAAMRTHLGSYAFQWGGTRDECAIALGYGSLYNHSDDPNAIYVRRLEDQVIAFVSLRAIAAGEEITVSYHGGFGDRSPVWFAVR
ncbi:MAG: SET domain-containing protein-lysine N-methyltransferase [Polyangiales bacterium]